MLSIDQCSWEEIEAAIRQLNDPNENGWVGVTIQSHDTHMESGYHSITYHYKPIMKRSKYFFDRSSGQGF